MIRELAELTRIEHALMLALAVLIAETIVLGGIPTLTAAILFSLLVPIFSEMGSFALNDYFDIEADRLNKMERPLVRGAISPAFAVYFSAASLIVSSALAYLINEIAFLIAVAFNIVAVLYNWKLKDAPLIGNIYIAFTMAIPFVFGSFVVSDSLGSVALILAALGFVAGLAREIIKSVQDMEGDVKARGSKTLPVIIGKKAAAGIAVILYLLFIPLTAMPFFFGLEAVPHSVILIIAADIMIIAICSRIISEDYRFARNASLLSFFIGLVGLLLSAV